MDDVHVRAATSEDGPRLRAIDIATWSSTSSPTPAPAAGEVRPFFEDGAPGDVLVAERGGQPVGWLRLTPSTPLASSAHAWTINGLAVDPEQQRQGVGQALLEAAVREVARRGGTKLALRVLAHNEPARVAYARAGFHVEGVLHDEFRLDGAMVDDLILARSIDPTTVEGSRGTDDDGGRTYDAGPDADVPTDVEEPMSLAAAWFAAAETAGERQPTAADLATVGEDGRPSARAVLMREVSGRGLVFHTNRRSRKGHELDANPSAAVCSVWNILHRQLRVEGTVVLADDETSDAYWSGRPAGSQASAAASPQSAVIPDRTWLEEQVAAVEAAHPGGIPRPAHWGGYLLVPDRVEFWAGRRDRLHERTLFTKRPDGTWERERLAP